MRLSSNRSLLLFVSLAVLNLSPPAQSNDRAPASAIPVETSQQPAARSFVRFEGSDQQATIVGYDAAALAQAFRDGAPFRVDGFPLSPTQSVNLELRPFSVLTEQTRFVVGSLDGPDRPLDFDASAYAFFTGRVVDHPQSDVFLALTPRRVVAHVALSHGERFEVSRRTHTTAGGVDSMQVFRSQPADGVHPGVPLCGVEDHADIKAYTAAPRLPNHTSGATAGTQPFTPATKRIRLAVETDYEFYQLFNDLDDAGDYVVAMIAAVSHIYIRDVNAYYQLTFVRLWDNPADLFNDADPLVPFRDYWNDNMGSVTRDVAHFASGRRDLPYGGVAYVGALCVFSGDYAYGVTGYLIGSFPEPSLPSSGHYDIGVVAHELGHNCGAFHTHSYGIDQCDDFNSTPQRGTIMSYCSQTHSGGNANDDDYFHSFVQGEMKSFLRNDALCLVDDCNRNGVSDATDIASFTSLDTNGNGIPDECEDCDGDGTLDPAEIAGGSLDLNGNGIPDECEPDCNSNAVPDERDILLATSTDAYGDNVPDECEDDCDSNGVSDYTQIQLDMSLDLNRNAVLDSCEDCNGNAIPDLEELDGSWNVWSASLNADGAIREFHADVGTVTRISDTGHVLNALDLLITPSSRIFVASSFTDSVIEFDRSGSYVTDFVSADSGGLDFPAGLAFMPGGDLLVSSRNTDSVIRYDTATGAGLGAFVASGSGGLSAPYGLTFGPNGNLFVTSSGNNQVIEYDGATGALVGVFVSTAGNGGLSGPRGIAFKSDGNLLVASFNTNRVLEYQGGSGAFVGQFNVGGTSTALTMDQPWGVRRGPDNHIYVSRHDESLLLSRGGPGELHLNASRIYIFDGDTGWFIRSFVTGNDTQMTGTTGFDFMPGHQLDCNRNFVLDECDILQGTSLDLDANGFPDECICDDPPPPAPEASPVERNRYFALVPPATGPGIALRVTFDNLDGFPSSNGEVRWVGPPASHADVGGNPPFHAAALQCQPFFGDWSALPKLYVFGEGIIPNSSYSIETLSECGGASGAPLSVATGNWGDIIAPFGGTTQPNFADVTAVVDSFKDFPGAPSKTRSKLIPSLIVPANAVSFADINATLDAFKGGSYPFAGPAACP